LRVKNCLERKSCHIKKYKLQIIYDDDSVETKIHSIMKNQLDSIQQQQYVL